MTVGSTTISLSDGAWARHDGDLQCERHDEEDRQRFTEEGIVGLQRDTRRGRPERGPWLTRCGFRPASHQIRCTLVREMPIAFAIVRALRYSTFGSVGELEAAIRGYLDRHNADPKPFMWTKTAETILVKERRTLERRQSLTGCQPTESEH